MAFLHLGRLLRRPRAHIIRLAQPRGPRRISAMMRVRNEAEFVGAALDSIVEHVDQVVIIDNLSTDSTPDAIRTFATAHGGKVKAQTYPHEIARPGSESVKLSNNPRAKHSPSLLANYYQWCLELCDLPYVLKWDGDMVATDEFGSAVREFRRRKEQSLWFFGINVYPDMKHAIADSNSTARIRPRSIAPNEPRVFPKRFAWFSNAAGIYETLVSPYTHDTYGFHWSAPVYLHLPLCKATPFHNNSSDFKWPNPWTLPYGQPLPDSMLTAVQRWGLRSFCVPPEQLIPSAVRGA